MKKKVLAMLLAVVLAVGLLPATAFAANASGKCGDNVTWTLSDGVLTIDGSGPMNDYSVTYYTQAPWYSQRSKIHTVVIGDGVTTIGICAFYQCSNLTSVTIGSGVTEIGNMAFCECTGLTGVTIPGTVTSIGTSAFRECSNLTRVTIGDGVTSIGDYAFAFCYNLTDVTVPDSVTSIGSSAFSGPWLQSLGEFPAVNGILITYRGNDADVVIPDGITAIGDSVFSNRTNLTSVTIPNGVTSIGAGAFQRCGGLISVTIPNSVTSIGAYAFAGCSGLTGVVIPDSVTSLGDSVFSYCSNLTSATIGSGVTSIGSNAFSECSSLTAVTIPNGVTSIGAGAFQRCGGLTSATIGSGVTSIGAYAFAGCSGLTGVVIPDNVTSLGDYAFQYCGLTSATVGGGVTSLGKGAFYNCDSLVSVTIGSGVTEIGTYTFLGCSSLTSLTIPDSITSLGSAAFTGSRLTNIYYGGSEEQWDKLTQRGLDEALLYAIIHFNGDTTESENPYPDFVINRGVLTKYVGPGGDVTIPSSVTAIGDHAFEGCSSVTSVTIPNSVTSIGVCAFAYCSGLTAITIPNGVTAIKTGTFESCNSLTSVTIPNSVTSIGNDAFIGCKSLTAITIPASVTSIGNSAFGHSSYHFISHVYYGGSEEQWGDIICTITNRFTGETTTYPFANDGQERAGLYNVNIHYDSPMPDTPSEPENPFTDVKPGTYYADAVAWALSNNITNGTTATTFNPSGNCRIIQILTMLYRAQRDGGKATADDMAEAEKWAREMGMIGDGFDTSAVCTRSQAVMFIWQARGATPPTKDYGFVDVEADAAYLDAVNWAMENGVSNGDGNSTTFSPDKDCTRGQIVTFLYRAYVQSL